MAKANTTESGSTTAEQDHQAIQAYLHSQDWEERLKGARVERALALAKRARERGEKDGAGTNIASFDLLARAREISATAKAQMGLDDGSARNVAAVPVDDFAGDTADDTVPDAAPADPAAEDAPPLLNAQETGSEPHGPSFALSDLLARNLPPAPLPATVVIPPDQIVPLPVTLPVVIPPVSTAPLPALPDPRRPTPLSHRAFLGLSVGMAAGLVIGLLLPLLTQGLTLWGDVQTIQSPLAEAPVQPRQIVAAAGLETAQLGQTDLVPAEDLSPDGLRPAPPPMPTPAPNDEPVPPSAALTPPDRVATQAEPPVQPDLWVDEAPQVRLPALIAPAEPAIPPLPLTALTGPDAVADTGGVLLANAAAYTVKMHLATADRAETVTGQLADLGLIKVDLLPSGFAASQTLVAFYRPQDADIATQLAERFGGTTMDLSGFAPAPEAGTLDLYLKD